MWQQFPSRLHKAMGTAEPVGRRHCHCYMPIVSCRAVWPTSKTRSCVCPDLDYKAFSMYVQWLYTSRLPIGSTALNFSEHSKALTSAWTIGRSIGNMSFLNTILHTVLEIIQDTHRIPSPKALRKIYAATSVDCDLRILLVRVSVQRADAEWFTINQGPFPPEFLTDLTTVLLQKREKKETMQVTLNRLYAAIEAGEGL
jgi:hypothetical protein